MPLMTCSRLALLDGAPAPTDMTETSRSLLVYWESVLLSHSLEPRCAQGFDKKRKYGRSFECSPLRLSVQLVELRAKLTSHNVRSWLLFSLSKSDAYLVLANSSENPMCMYSAMVHTPMWGGAPAIVCRKSGAGVHHIASENM